LTVLILVFGPVSGAHFNPAVSLAFYLRRELSLRDLVVFVAAQALGAIAGVLIAHLMFDLPLLQVSLHVRSGSAQWFAEGVATFGLLITIFGCLVNARASGPFAVGLYIMAAYWFTASTSFANPAVTLARCLTDTFAGIAPGGAPGFVLAQLAGALAAVVFAGWLWGTESVDKKPRLIGNSGPAE
jgi:glycerol uptake facilitator-like aquaporin